jgi:hypothetical protein
MRCAVFPSGLSRPALKRVIKIEPLCRNAEALLPLLKQGFPPNSGLPLSSRANSEAPPLPKHGGDRGRKYPNGLNAPHKAKAFLDGIRFVCPALPVPPSPEFSHVPELAI